ncbi:unnamed protein product [Rotaria socialis]|uniref:Uncharacterized protein n=1 Tax=Rotaria socialis TaxID=392032 RepID=A0A820VAR9_9BILA|nr:unnamed protein product [Rotaria socialis]CAF4497122.1 unnamed protein product [Rotaria socialis]
MFDIFFHQSSVLDAFILASTLTISSTSTTSSTATTATTATTSTTSTTTTTATVDPATRVPLRAMVVSSLASAIRNRGQPSAHQ